MSQQKGGSQKKRFC